MRLLLLLPFFILNATQSFSQIPIKEKLEFKRLELENKYRSVGQFDSLTGIATVYDNGKMGFIDTSGKIILPLGEYVTSDFSHGIGIWKNKGTIKAINKLGKVVDEYPNLESLMPVKNGLFMISVKGNKNGHYGIMNISKKIIVKCNYSGIDKISKKYYKVIENGVGSGVINNDGDTIIPLRYIINYIDTINLKFIGYRNDVGYAIFNSNGTVKKHLNKIYPVTFSIEGNIYTERNGVIIIKDKFSDDNAKYALVNTNFDTIIPPGKYFHLSDINEGLIKFEDSVSRDKYGRRTNPYQYVKCGFLNSNGEVVIPSKFDFAHYFTEGLSGVRINEKWGFINYKGKVVIPLKYDYVLPFKNGFAKVQLKDNFYIIDKTGKIVLNSKSN